MASFVSFFHAILEFITAKISMSQTGSNHAGRQVDGAGEDPLLAQAYWLQY